MLKNSLLGAFLFASIFYTNLASAQKKTPAKTVLKAKSADELADSVLQRLTLRQRIGQLFVTFANGEFYAEGSDEFYVLSRRVTLDGVGGIIFSTGGIYDQGHLTNRLQKIAAVPLLISQDMEFGAAMRIRGTTRLTPAMGIAATGNPKNAFIAGQITASEAKALGVHQIYAPAADINNNPKNPIINVRSFSERPDVVGEFASAFMKGVLSQGLIPTAKHFPGHGDTDVDSHIDLPVIRHSWKRLDTLELIPFRRLIKEGLPSMMSAHISFPNMSANPATPGTLDPAVLRRILLDSLKFPGVVITDALTMEAVTKQFSPGRAALMALEAGADILLMSTDETSAIDELEKAVNAGLITEERINFSIRKTLKWKAEQGLFTNRFIAIDSLKNSIAKPGYLLEAQRIARESVTLLRNNGVLPVTAFKYPKVAVIAIADDQSGNAGRVLVREIRRYHDDVTFGLFDGRTSTEEREQILKRAEKADLIIIGAYIFVRMEGKIQFSKEQADFVNRLNALNKPSVVIAFGNPYIVSEFPQAAVHLAAWSNATEQVEQAVPALFGASPIQGTLPITIPGLYPFGSGLKMPQTANRPDQPAVAGFNKEKLRRVERILEQAIRDSVFPGAQLAVVRDGILVMNRSFGYHTYEKNQPVRNADVYDAASLTKILATTPAIMRLVADGKLRLTDPVSTFFPEWKSGKKKEVTIRHLLEHNSGLPAFRPYADEMKSPEMLRQAVINEPLVEEPGKKMVYSDLGFMLLGWIVEQVSGEKLHVYVQKRIWQPAGMTSTTFLPLQTMQNKAGKPIPTERDTVWRKKLISGEVHDERAWALGGISGHAGVFTNAGDVAAFASMLQNKGLYAGQNILPEAIVTQFTERKGRKDQRLLGFDVKKETGGAAGTKMSYKTFGHTGFTGTSVWMDPESGVSIVLLTNRVHPFRSYGGTIQSVRGAIADAVMESLVETK